MLQTRGFAIGSGGLRHRKCPILGSIKTPSLWFFTSWLQTVSIATAVHFTSRKWHRDRLRHYARSSTEGGRLRSPLQSSVTKPHHRHLHPIRVRQKCAPARVCIKQT